MFDVPHSRFNEIGRDQFEAAGLQVLVEGDVAGVHLGRSEDLFRFVYFQGHPEYDTISLLKEYKREVKLYAQGLRADYPPFPDNYFTLKSEILERNTRTAWRPRAPRACRCRNSPKSMCARHCTTPGTTPPRACSTTGSARSTRSPTTTASCRSSKGSSPTTRSGYAKKK